MRPAMRIAVLGACLLGILGAGDPDLHLTGSAQIPLAIAVPPEVLPGTFELTVGGVTVSRESLAEGVGRVRIDLDAAVVTPLVTTSPSSGCQLGLGWTATAHGFDTTTAGSVVVEIDGLHVTSIPFRVTGGESLQMTICGGRVSVGPPSAEPSPSPEPSPPAPDPDRTPDPDPTPDPDRTPGPTEEAECGRPPRSSKAEGRGDPCPRTGATRGHVEGRDQGQPGGVR